MSTGLRRYIERIEYIDWLISKRATGPPEEFAKKLGLSRSSLMNYLKLLRDMNAPIAYDLESQTYHYLFPCRLKVGYEHEVLDEEEMKVINKVDIRNFCKIVLIQK